MYSEMLNISENLFCIENFIYYIENTSHIVCHINTA